MAIKLSEACVLDKLLARWQVQGSTNMVPLYLCIFDIFFKGQE